MTAHQGRFLPEVGIVRRDDRERIGPALPLPALESVDAAKARANRTGPQQLLCGSDPFREDASLMERQVGRRSCHNSPTAWLLRLMVTISTPAIPRCEIAVLRGIVDQFSLVW